MPTPVFGTAHLFGQVDAAGSAAVLEAAWQHGFRAFDTAPLYGHGRSETELGARLAGRRPPPRLTTKVGLEPAAVPSVTVRAVKAVARRLPAAVRQRLRPGDGVPRGTFDPDLVRWSLDRSLLRLGRIDRLMLHEAHAEDLTDDLVELLAGLLARGDVGQVGVATVNAQAAAVARRAPDVITAAHVEVGPDAPAVDLPAGVTTVVGHGVLGPGGQALRALTARVGRGGPAADRWVEVTAGTGWAGDRGLAEALVARAAALPLSDVIVATSRPARLPALRALAAGERPLPDGVAAALAALVADGRADASGA